MDWIIFFKLLLSSYLCTPLILLTYEIINDEFLPRRKKKKRHPQLEDIPQPKPFTIHTRQIMKSAKPLLDDWERRAQIAGVPRAKEAPRSTQGYPRYGESFVDYIGRLAEQNPSVDFGAGALNQLRQRQPCEQLAYRTRPSDGSIEVNGRTIDTRDWGSLTPAQRYTLFEEFERRHGPG